MVPTLSIIRMHDEATVAWHQGIDFPPPTLPAIGDSQGILRLVLENHRSNFDLWHQEDEARSPKASDATIAAVKHAIDGLNQRRNDLVEQIDLQLFAEASPQNELAPLHSETPGLILDRLSILALKVYHTNEESVRGSATVQHRERNLARLKVLENQRGDLAGCLEELWEDVLAGQRRFKLYRQMKMYNDPDLNPVLYLGAS